MYRTTGAEADRLAMVNARKLFKSEARTCRRRYSREQTNKVINAQYVSVKLYWELIMGHKRSSFTRHPKSENSFSY